MKAVPLPTADARTESIRDEGHAVPDVDRRILNALREINHFTAMYSRRLRAEHNITLPQLVCLLSVCDEGPLTQAGLSQRVSLSSSTLVGILDRLEDRGLVRRERDRRDRRKVNVTVTEAGRRLAAENPFPLQKQLSCALHRLPEEEQWGIAHALEKVAALMQPAVDAAVRPPDGPPPSDPPPAL